mmetsp:Transcript_14407/g.28680  ORF Transcript_14407/g.28680 Transcript_14407/m.28680 type:complete len:232 (+) Transcript_14407:70-765(+)
MDYGMMSMSLASNSPGKQGAGGSPKFSSPKAEYAESRRKIANKETAAILKTRYMERTQVKQKMLDEQARFRRKRFESRQQKTASAIAKTQKSPFLVDLLAENEKIDEENRVRLAEQSRRQKVFERRKEEAKNAIILKALQEASDLDALRREKRIIMEEERRLKALLDIEKTKAHRKADRLAAARAERQRKSAKSEYRRAANKEMLDDHMRREHELLMVKHEVEVKPNEFKV